MLDRTAPDSFRQLAFLTEWELRQLAFLWQRDAAASSRVCCVQRPEKEHTHTHCTFQHTHTLYFSAMLCAWRSDVSSGVWRSDGEPYNLFENRIEQTFAYIYIYIYGVALPANSLQTWPHATCPTWVTDPAGNTIKLYFVRCRIWWDTERGMFCMLFPFILQLN